MRRLIEDQFPVKEVSVFAAREKLIRQGHIVNLHIWWARRPLASSRATEYAALVPAPANDDELNKQRKFIIEFAKWENSTNLGYIEKARDDILAAYGGVPPRVLDPFAGGGALPLEALRLGCETFASDLNPVAVLIEKATLEYPQKYGNTKKGLVNDSSQNHLLADIRRWRDEVFLEARNELERFYPSDQDGYSPVAYIWAHVIPCQNPSCQAEIPLLRQFWLAKKKGREVALYPHVENGELKFRLVGSDHGPIPTGFDPG